MLNRYWRILTTGLCFSIFGLGALFLVSGVFPVVALFNPSKLKRSCAIRRTIQISFKMFVWLMSVTDLISVSTKNFDAVRKSKCQIIVANHPSLIDIVILISMLPQGDCVVKEALGRNFFLKNLIKTAYVLASTEVEDLLKSCKKSLSEGNSFIIFPEGTRTVPGKKSKLSRGAANLAIYSEADILPIHISCTPPGLLKNQKWYDVADRALVYVLEAKSVIRIKPYLENENKHAAAKELTGEIGRMLGLVDYD
jgi:1-acyl-sn-glycerol-3-phosphate acyltransferase